MTTTSARVGDQVTWGEFLSLPIGTVARTVLSDEHPALVYVVYRKGAALAPGIRNSITTDAPNSYRVRILEVGTGANMGLNTEKKEDRNE